MAGPGGREVGRVSVRVVPNTSGFSRELLAELKAIERTALVNIRTNLDSDQLVGEARRAVAAAEKGAIVDVGADFDAGSIAEDARRAVQRAEAAAGKVTVGGTFDDNGLTSDVRRAVSAAEARAGVVQVGADLDADGLAAEARAAVEAAELAAGSVVVPVKLDKRQAEQAAVTLGRSMNGLIATAIVLGPALIPVAAGLAAVFLAVAAPLTAATAGLGAFAILAIPTIKNVVDASAELEKAQKAVTDAITDKERTKALTELERLTASLSPTTLAAVAALDKVKQGFADLRTVLQDDIMSVFNAGLAVAVAALPAIGALAKAVSPALVQVADSLAAAFNRTGVEGFVGFLTDRAASAILGFAYGLANIARGFASMMVAFDPVSRSIGAGLDAMLQKFAVIGQSEGFRQFVGYVQSVGPLVTDTLGSVFRAVGALVIAFAPLGAVALVVIRGIADAINAIPLPLLTVLIGVIVAVAAAVGIANIALAIQTTALGLQAAAAGISTAATWALNTALAVLTSPIFAVVLAIGVLVGGFILAYRQSETFRNIVNGAVNAVRATAVTVFNFLRDLITGTWSAIVGATSSAMAAVSGGVSSAFAAVRGVVTSVMGAVVGFIVGAMARVISLFSGGFGQAAAAVAANVGSVLAIVRGLPGQIVGALGNLGSLLYNSGRSIIQGLVSGIGSMAGAVKNAVSGVLSAARNLLPFSPAKEGPFSGRGWTTYSGASIVDGLIQGLESREAAAVRATAGLAGSMSNALNVEGSVAAGATTRAATLEDVTARLDRLTAVVERMPREQQTMRRRR